QPECLHQVFGGHPLGFPRIGRRLSIVLLGRGVITIACRGTLGDVRRGDDRDRRHQKVFPRATLTVIMYERPSGTSASAYDVCVNWSLKSPVCVDAARFTVRVTLSRRMNASYPVVFAP